MRCVCPACRALAPRPQLSKQPCHLAADAGPHAQAAARAVATQLTPLLVDYTQWRAHVSQHLADLDAWLVASREPGLATTADLARRLDLVEALALAAARAPPAVAPPAAGDDLQTRIRLAQLAAEARALSRGPSVQPSREPSPAAARP